MVTKKSFGKKFSIVVTNIVATSAVDFQVDLNKFAELNGFTIDEDYPIGVHCRSDKIAGIVTVFRTGKMISVGSRTIEQTKKNLSFIQNLLKEQRKQLEII
ncbi:TATA-box-binding protein 2 [Candidatus Gugararchaeum adminiculabundum]|nr:TATA-box-binding protein 2 [Candidatus Gugararchaeum adminiculabundum]